MIKNAVFCIGAMQHFGKQVAEILDWPLFIDSQVGSVDHVLIIGMYDAPYYGFTLENTKFAKRRSIQWCGTDVQLLQEARALPFATHVCDGENLQKELSAKGVEATVAYMPTLIHPKPGKASSKEKVVAFYSGASAEQYGSSIVTALMDCLPDWKLFSYKFGQFPPEAMYDIVKECTVYVRLTKHDGGMVSAREFLEAGKPVVVTQEIPFATVVNPDNFLQVVKEVKKAGEVKGPNLEAAEFYKKFNSEERYVSDLMGAGIVE